MAVPGANSAARSAKFVQAVAKIGEAVRYGTPPAGQIRAVDVIYVDYSSWLRTLVVYTGNVPARKSVAQDMSKFPPANAMLYYNVLDKPAKLVPAPPRFNQMESIILRYTGSVFANEAKPADALAAAQKELESVVACKK